MTRVVLVNMPFASTTAPSIGLGILKASLQAAGHKVAVLDLQLDFEQRIGADAYTAIEQMAGIGPLAGEWLFSEALFPGLDSESYIREILLGEHPNQSATLPAEVVEHILFARNAIEPFLDASASLVCELRPNAVGLTSLFQQHCAALALACRLNSLDEALPLWLGGPNCDGVMGRQTISSFSFLSAVMLGESDHNIVDLVERLTSGQSLSDLPGVVTKECIEGQKTESRVVDLDDVPIPDYSDFFTSVEAVGKDPTKTTLPFETSRGCWWGAKQHCVFCGINGNAMPFREKSPDRAETEIRELAARYPSERLAAVDNILSHSHLRKLLPRLASKPIGKPIFYEIKSNLDATQVRLIRSAGITAVQPGIESLDTETLMLMKKGVTGIQNLALLRTSEQCGLSIYWNLLWGFPHEPARASEDMILKIIDIIHLPPPGASGPILLNRFSPHYEHAADFGLTNVRPFPAYYHIYPLGEEAVQSLAYYFTYNIRPEASPGQSDAELQLVLSRWRERHSKAFLFMTEKRPRLVLDGRQDPLVFIHLSETASRILRLGDGLITFQNLGTLGCSGEDLESAIDELERKHLIVREDRRIVVLPLDLDSYSIQPDDEHFSQRKSRLQRARQALAIYEQGLRRPILP